MQKVLVFIPKNFPAARMWADIEALLTYICSSRYEMFMFFTGKEPAMTFSNVYIIHSKIAFPNLM